MHRSAFQLSVAGMIVLIACFAVNLWLFHVSILAGVIGLNLSKHLLIAYLCQVLGVDRRVDAAPAPTAAPAEHGGVPAA